MVLKVVKKKKYETKQEGIAETIIDYYESKRINIQNGFAMIDSEKDMIDLGEYSLYDEVLGDFCNYIVIEAYILNNEGKTIEKL